MLQEAELSSSASGEVIDYRDEVVSFLRRRLLGPADGVNEQITDPPRIRYLLGILFPQKAIRGEVLVEEDSDGENATDEDAMADASTGSVDDWLPSSLAISFFVNADAVEVDLWAARYTEITSGKSRRWSRSPIAEPATPEKVTLRSSGPPSLQVLGARATLTSVWRPFESGYLVTVAMVNSAILEVDAAGQMSHEERTRQDTECLHQVGFRCRALSGAILKYPSIGDTFRDDEDEELRLLYAHADVFAVGHGCSVTWESDEPGEATSVATEHMPSYDVAPLEYDLDGFADILQLANLVTYQKATLIERLQEFIDCYDTWLASLSLKIVASQHLNAKQRIVARIAEAATRMRSGVRYLADHDDALECFQLANRAMLLQMHQSREVMAERSFARNETVLKDLNVASSDYSWRPFQLAFQLLTIKGAAESESPERLLVDLVWFPTGGGKTEAYLSLAAYVIFLRRVRNGERGGGTAVITRYTLSLLTSQQFQRAATLVCACEQMRRADPSRLGSEPITIGLWIGEKQTPNRFSKAREQFNTILEEDEPRNPFQMQQCPWCGTLIVPRERSIDPADYGIRAGDHSFELYCPTDACPFNGLLPIAVIDEQLYRNPPTILLATVDKFAQLPWDGRAGSFFGTASVDPPSLIIQDELHLLSGPLGTMVGLYETGIEALISLNGRQPKIIAATATIRRAPEQIAGLFGRSTTRVFPPSGIDSRDSFYARASSRPGRRYVGVLPQSHSTQTSMVNVASALLQSPIACTLTKSEFDAMWTLIVYHNSLRELGRTINLSRDDIPERLKAWFGADARAITEDSVMELRSNLDGAALPKRLQRLKVESQNAEALSIVGCTNMFSVGVDVQRLGVMLVNGQPKSTSEYIQATSRVGRGKAAGVVVALYGATRPRDRSLYEQFIAFHSTFYMRVEPTSVTPFSPPARERALHAVFVMLMRHWGGLSQDDSAGEFRKDARAVTRIVAEIKRRVREVDPVEETATLAELTVIIDDWANLASSVRSKNKLLFYKNAGRAQTNLLGHFGKPQTGYWPTLTSMRNVDAECSIGVLGER